MLQGQADAKQLDTWLPKALSREIIGCYCQTERSSVCGIMSFEIQDVIVALCAVEMVEF